MRDLRLFFVERSQRLGRPSSGRHSKERIAIAGREHDRPILRPASAPVVRGVGERDGGTPDDGDLLQLTGGEIADPLSVGREEWAPRPFSARERGRLCLIQSANEDLRRRLFPFPRASG